MCGFFNIFHRLLDLHVLGTRKGFLLPLTSVSMFFCFFLFSSLQILDDFTGTNLSLTEHKGSTGEYWPKVVTVRTERSKVCLKKPPQGQYSPVRS